MKEEKNNYKFDPEKIIQLSSSITSVNIFKNFENYNDRITISQVVRFFERHNITFTKTMIQNYVRVGILPPPIDRRYYIKNHLILLTVIYNLKEVYSLEEIGNIFKPITNDSNTFDDDILDMGNIYNEYISLYEKSIKDFTESIPTLLNRVLETTNAFDIDGKDKEKVLFFLTMLTIMTQSIATKELVRLMSTSNRYEEKQ